MMCPLMSFFATLFFKDSHNANFFAMWVQTTAMNYPAAFLWQLCGAGPLVRFVFGKGLAAMKKNGLKTGTQNVIEDQLAWLFENNAQEYVLRKSDGAIMQNMLTGDKVINPQGAENLYNFAMNPDQFLESRSSLEVGAAGVEKLNRLIQQQSEHQAKLSGSYRSDNSEILSKMDSMMSTMESMMENMASSMKNLKVFMDKDKLVGELREDMNIKNEMAATRYTRGRLR